MCILLGKLNDGSINRKDTHTQGRCHHRRFGRGDPPGDRLLFPRDTVTGSVTAILPLRDTMANE
jgi:hypothetical protein